MRSGSELLIINFEEVNTNDTNMLQVLLVDNFLNFPTMQTGRLQKL